ncbi:heterokaryon incompatibility protein-domain-containing protein, partial [Pyrenochaeta sp. MPI-SDFR-AT-0127]
VPDQPNFEVASNWLRRCRETHLEACNRVHGRTHTLRLIDCKTRRLIVAKQGQPYICLSYVWGEAVHKAEFSTELPDVVPKTVEDAMFVAVNLEIPYLWVDRYCIDQANPLEKHNLIQNMDRVYQNADITIIAAVGDNPHYGLPGVRGTSRQRQLSLTVGEHTFVTAEEVAGQVKKSTWMSRGWTFQEMLLSRRRLIFTESQMYFQC